MGQIAGKMNDEALKELLDRISERTHKTTTVKVADNFCYWVFFFLHTAVELTLPKVGMKLIITDDEQQEGKAWWMWAKAELCFASIVLTFYELDFIKPVM